MSHRRLLAAAAALATTPLSLAAAPSALAAAPVALAAAPVALVAAPGPHVGPDQGFIGLVNGRASNAQIQVFCPGPVRPFETGHPTGGQSVSAALILASPVTGGFTGGAATRIDVHFLLPASGAAAPSPVIRRYGVAVSLPATLELPCSGTGAVSFVPDPTSPTARPAAVSVTYVNVGVADPA